MSFPKYEDYKDSGVEWLGEVPAHWNMVPLKHLAEFINGDAFKPSEWAEEGVPIIRIQNLNGGVDFNYCSGVVEERYLVNEGDLLFGWSGNRGTSFGPFLWEREGVYALNQHIFRVVPYSVAKGDLYWILKAVTAHVEDQAHGIIGMVHVTKGDLGAIKVPVPNEIEQKAIADFLSCETTKLDALITEQRTLIDLLKEKRQAVISHAVTKGLDPRVPMKDSGVEWLGEVPAHWDVRPVKSIASIGNGATPNRDRPDYWSDGNYPWLSSTVVNQDIVTEATEFVTQVALDECHLPKIMPPAILVGITGQGKTRGMAAILGFEATINQHIACVKPIDEACVGFVRRYFDMAYERMRFESDGAGSTKGAITCEQIANMKMPLPPIAEQKNIGDYIDREMNAIDALTAEAQTTIALLQERRSALISAAVTGKIDVRQHTTEAA